MPNAYREQFKFTLKELKRDSISHAHTTKTKQKKLCVNNVGIS